MNVTVAVCTWNRADLLLTTLEHLTRVVVPAHVAWELVVVNNNCTDRTDDVIARFLGRLPLRRVFEARPGLCHARNAAILEARGEWLMFTDDDVLVAPDWITECMTIAVKFPNAGVVGGRIEPWFPVKPDPAILDAFPIARNGFCGIDHGSVDRILDMDENVYGANMAFKMKAISGVKFNPAFGPSPSSSVTGDEVDFIRRLRLRDVQVVWAPRMRVQHYVDPARLTIPYLRRYHTDHARMQVRSGSVPQGQMWWGAPRWLWRSTAAALIRYLFEKARHGPKSLTNLRDYCHLRGMLLECRAVNRDSHRA